MSGDQPSAGGELTTEQAAARLNLTVPDVIALLEAETIPSYWTSGGYRIAPDDIAAYEQRGPAPLGEAIEQAAGAVDGPGMG